MSRERHQKLVDKYVTRGDRREEGDVRSLVGADKPFSHIGDMPGGRGSEQPAIRFYAKHYHDADQLHDVSADPEEQRNLAADPRHAEILAMMKEELRQHLLQVPGGFGEFKTVE